MPASLGSIARCIRLIAVLVLASPLLAAGQPEAVRLQLKWRHAFQFAGYYAAQEKGYYRAAGLNVTLQEARPGDDSLQVVTRGDAEFGIGNSNLLLARYDGKPVVAVATIFQHSPLVLLARQDAGINSVKELAGRTIMLEPHSDELIAMLRQAGVSPSDIRPIEHAFEPSSLIEGRVVAMSAYVTNETWFLEQAGIAYRTFSPLAAGIDFYGDTLFTTDALLKNKPELVAAFRAASLQGWRYALEHPEEIARLIHEKYSSYYPLDFLRHEARQMLPLIQAELVEIGYMSPTRWRLIADTYASLGLLPPNTSLAGYLYEPVADSANTRNWKVLAATVVGLLLVVGLITLHIQRTNRRLQLALQQQGMVEVQLRESESRHRTLFQTTPSAAVVWSDNCIVTDWNRQAELIFGWRREEVLGRCFVDFMIPEPEKSEIGGKLLHLTEENVLPHSINRNQTKDGRIITCEWFNAWLPSQPGTRQEVISIGNDITQRKQLEDEVRHLAFFDTLTGLPNRRLLHDRIDQARAASNRQHHYCALMLLDLDNFKPLNDTHGHEVGDLLLIEAARRMKQCVRETDTVARFGGDEFVVLIGALGPNWRDSEDLAVQVAEKIRVALAAPYQLHARSEDGSERVIEHRCSVSIGITLFHDHQASDSDLLKWADIAMYQAKEAGRNRVVIHQPDSDTLLSSVPPPIQQQLPLHGE